MKFGKKILAVILALATIICSQTFVARAEEDPVKILFLGNSLVYYNQMDTVLFPKLCEALGKNVQVESVVKGGSSLYRLSNEKTSEGKQAAEKLANNTYDYVVLQPSRHVSPVDPYNPVYKAEKAAAIKLNSIISLTGAKTLLLAAPGVNSGEIEVCTLDEEDVKIVENEYLPIDRKTHQRFFESLCNDFVSEMVNAGIVRVGVATELVIDNFPDFNSLYRDDNRHPSNRGSYLQAACIYATIFGESPVGAGYTDSIYNHNAIVLQRAAAIAVLGESKDIFNAEKADITLSGEMWSNSEINLFWNEPIEASYYEIYRKSNKEKSFVNIGRTIENECGYIDESVKAGYTYTYKIKPYYKVGDLTFQANEPKETSFVTFGKMKKPTVTLVNKTTAKLNFESVETAQFYSIYRKKSSDSKFEYINSTKTTEYIDDELTAGNLYSYYVVAEKQNGMVVSGKSTTRSIFACASPKFKATSSSGNVTLSITAVKGANKYAIYYKKSSESSYKKLTVTTSTSYTVTGLSKGVKYNFKVRACKDKNSNSTASLFRSKTVKIK